MGISTKLFVYNSQDDYIKRCLKKHGWVENYMPSSNYDLKWVYTDNPEDFAS